MKILLAAFVALLVSTSTNVLPVGAQEAGSTASNSTIQSLTADTDTKSPSNLTKPLNLQSMPLIQNQIITNTSDISKLNQQNVSLSTNVTALQSNLKVLTESTVTLADFSVLESAVSSDRTVLSLLVTDTDVVQLSVSQLQSNYDDLFVNVQTLQEQQKALSVLPQLESDMSTLNSEVIKLSESTAALTTKVNATSEAQVATANKLADLETNLMKPLVVVDGNKELVGYLIGTNPSMQIYEPKSNKILNFNSADGSMTHYRGSMVAFNDYNCTGQPYYQGKLGVQTVLNTNSGRYFESDGDERVSKTGYPPVIKSFLRDGTTCHSRHSNTWLGNLGGYYKLKEIQMPLELPLTAPLTIQTGL